MPEIDNLRIRITAIDEATPVLRRLRREVFWMQVGGPLGVTLVSLVAFIGGLLLGFQF